MPDWKCPRCNATLREEDSCVYEAPLWMHSKDFTVSIRCWVCTWSTEWVASNLLEIPDEVELPA